MGNSAATNIASARPVFIVSSGRSGTRALQSALSLSPIATTHHEYMVHILQPLAVQYWMHLADRSEVLKTLGATYGAALAHAETPIWIDSSNKTSWLIEPLADLFPNARFVHLIRDGRKVVSSYFHKLGDEIYDDRSTAVLSRYACDHVNRRGMSPPPPEKKYWWPIPTGAHPDAAAFNTYDQFDRIAWHWAEINRTIIQSLNHLPRGRHIRAHLEAIVSDPEALRQLFNFIGLDNSDEAFIALQRPLNVNRPENNILEGTRRDRFDEIAGAMMSELGYTQAREYMVAY